MKHVAQLFLLSNMYPSQEFPAYGIFVKRFEEQIKGHYDIHQIVLTKKKSFYKKFTGYIILYWRSLKVILKAGKEDIIYVHFPLYFAPILLLLWVVKRKTFLNFHGSDAVFDSALKNILKLFLSPIINKCIIIVPSRDYKTHVEGVWNLTPELVNVYPSGGVDRNIFYPLSSKKDIFTLGFVGNFIEYKGWIVFLESLRHLQKKLKVPFKAIMIGNGPDSGKVKKFITECGLEVVVKSKMKQSQLVKTYAQMDLFIFPSYRESLGLVGLEAMMCGVPVIASDIPGPSSYISEGFNGYLFPKRDSKALSQKIMKYTQLSDEKKKQMKENCQNTAMKYESGRVAGIIKKIINQGGGDA